MDVVGFIGKRKNKTYTVHVDVTIVMMLLCSDASFTLLQAPESYKNVTDVVDTCKLGGVMVCGFERMVSCDNVM